MTSERALLRETAAAIFAEHCAPDARAAAGGWLPELWRDVAEAEFTLVGIPEEAGGAGGTAVDAAIVLLEAGRAAAPIPLAEALVAGHALALAGAQLPAGVLTLAFVDETARAEVPWGRVADAVVLVGPDSVASLAPGAEFKRHANLAGEPRDLVRANSTRELLLPGAGRELFARAALARTVLLAGCLQRCLDIAAGYAQDRTQFGRPIGRFQAVQELLAEMAGEAAAASAAALGAAETLALNPSRTTLPIAAAKVRAARAATVVCRNAHQVLGAIGMTDEHELHHFTTRAWAWRDEYGAELDWSRRLGEMVVSGGLWEAVVGGDPSR